MLQPGLPVNPPSGAHSQGGPGPDPGRQLRWQLMGALVGRKLRDSTAAPGREWWSDLRPCPVYIQLPISPLPASRFPCWLPAPVFLHWTEVKAILALSELGLVHLAEGTTGGRYKRK